MTATLTTLVRSTLFALLAVQLISAQSLQAAPAQRSAANSASARKKAAAANAMQRPVRPNGVESGMPVTGAEIFTERYPDGSVRIEREVALDAKGNYVNHGPYRMWSKSGKLIAEGDYNMGARSGIWTRWADRKEAPLLSQTPFKNFKAPFISQANFVNGVIDGEWLIFDAQQRKCSQVSITGGKRNGMAMLWAPDGTLLRQSTFENGMPQGDVLAMKAGTRNLDRVQVFLDGREVISKKTTFPRSNKTKLEAGYLAAPTVETEPDSFWSIRFAKYKSEGETLRHGQWKTWHPSGKLQMTGQYERGQKVGRFVYWHPNGQISAEGSFRDDKHEGNWVWWHDNGQKAIAGTFRNGTLIEQWRWWNETGHLTKQVVHDGTKQLGSQDVPELNLGMRPPKQSRRQR